MASYYNENTILFLNGEYVKASEAKMDFYSQSLHYGYSVFEGIRSYKTVSGETKIFKATEHFDRLRNSALSMNMPYAWTNEELIEASYEVLKRNNLQDAYIRPVVYAPANMSFVKNEVSYIFIEVWEMAPFFGDKLLRIITSSFQRPNPKGFKITAKAAGHYVNSILASQEAKANGYDEALLTDMNGFVAEGVGANMFYEKDGREIKIKRIYNRVIFDELVKRTDLKLEFNLTEDVDVEWAGHRSSPCGSSTWAIVAWK